MFPGRITFHVGKVVQNPVFSILIPSWNNLEILKICVGAIRKNSVFNHQIIVHANQATDGTLGWLDQEGISYSHSADNAGVCYGFNAAGSLATAQYICLLDDDMYVCPGWDKALMDVVNSLNNNMFCISGTLIQPRDTPYNCMIGPYNYGRNAADFQEEKLLREYAGYPFGDWNGCNWYPMILHKQVWDLIGGLSTEFSPGMYSDPDFMMKLWNVGIRYFRGVSESRAYHFLSLTTSRVKKNDGRKQFLFKWGISSSTFFRFYLRIGTPFKGPLPEPEYSFSLKINRIRNRINRLFTA
jgi:glycosyltransferase involved in cell wall biosynthesis